MDRLTPLGNGLLASLTLGCHTAVITETSLELLKRTNTGDRWIRRANDVDEGSTRFSKAHRKVVG
jgi:hypothetical protein